MSVESSNSNTAQCSAIFIPTRRFIITVNQLINLSPFYLDNIEVYHRDNNRLMLLGRELIDVLVSKGGHPTSRGTSGSRQSWDNLEVVIPDVEKSSPFDSYSDIHKAYHLAIVVAGDIPRLTTDLPKHLQVVDSYMNSKLKTWTPLHKMPDYFMQLIHVLDKPVKRIFSNYSNTVFVLTYLTTTACVSINSKLDLYKGTIEYELEFTPGTKKTAGITSRGQSSYQGKILLWNCRGAQNETFAKNFTALIAKHRPCVTILTDTRIGSRDAENVIENLPYTGCYQIESIQGSGGVWFLYADWDIKVRQVQQTEMSIKGFLHTIHEDTNDSE